MTKNKKAIFLDRDGVINIDKSYVHKIENFEFVDGIFEFCQYIKNTGYLIIIITNQSGIGRGYYTKEDFEKLTSWMLEQFKNKNLNIDAIYFCPHDPEEKCSCRKPSDGMLKFALKDFDIDLKNSWMIGDKESDIEFAINGKIKNHILINPNPNIKTKANFVAKSIKECEGIIGV